MSKNFGDHLVDLMMVTLIVIVGAVMLAGLGAGGYYLVCSGHSGITHEQQGYIEDISFQPAHIYHHCSKGCYDDFIPDTWFANVCDDNFRSHPDQNWCKSFEITHAPWEWQKKGAPIVITVEKDRCDNEWNYISFRKI